MYVCVCECVSLHLTLSWHELYPFSIAEGFSFRKSLFFCLLLFGLVWFGLETSCFVAQADLELTVDDGSGRLQVHS